MNKRPNRRRKSSRNDTRIVVGSTNVFADLGIPDADKRFAKVQLAYRIHLLIDNLGLRQTAAAKVLGTDRASISNLERGRLAEFSIGRLGRMLRLLEETVDAKAAQSALAEMRRNKQKPIPWERVKAKLAL